MQMPTDIDLEVVKTKLLRGLADRSRLMILASLHAKSLTVGEIVETTNLSQSNVSNHLACLKNCGLVTCEQSGRYVTYKLSNRKIEELLSLVEDLAKQCAHGIDNCAHYTE
jgi:ArsR family transcriptional regulator, cadmium/lead-responsive transcriptional repressor